MTKLIPEAPERAWLEINLGALLRNGRRFRDLAGVPLLPMLKANGYGLGAIPVARALESLEPWGYGVAALEEGRELRAAGITRPILVFSPLEPHPGAIAAVRAAELRPVIGDRAALEAWCSSGGGPFHLEIDTGMSRSGFRWHDEASLTWLRRELAARREWEGVFTHFHSADTAPGSVTQQVERFQGVLEALGRRPPLVHLANSAAAPQLAGLVADLARPGIFLYGGRAGPLDPEPVAALRARVVALRQVRPGDTISYGADTVVPAATRIATLSIGYGDGVPRSLGGSGMVELRGVIVPIAGRITMDMLMLDVGNLPVAVGDVVTLFGGLVGLDELAGHAGTISYELLTSVSARVPRHYQDS